MHADCSSTGGGAHSLVKLFRVPCAVLGQRALAWVAVRASYCKCGRVAESVRYTRERTVTASGSRLLYAHGLLRKKWPLTELGTQGGIQHWLCLVS